MFDPIESMAEIVLGVCPAVSYTILDIGARPLSEEDGFYRILDLFPGSRIIAFEVEQGLCDELNQSARPGLEYHAVALANTEGRRKFFETQHPMCSSLYKPDEQFLGMFHGLEVASLKRIHEIETVRLDTFASKRDLVDFDFMKIDVQGAELDVFRGAVNSLKGIVGLVSEVEFARIYQEQPLFGDVCDFLSDQQIEFHKFLGFAGRLLKPFDIARHGQPITNHMWADAFFVRAVRSLSSLPSSKLLKFGFLAFFYGSPDLAQLCLVKHDERFGSKTLDAYVNLLNRLEIR